MYILPSNNDIIFDTYTLSLSHSLSLFSIYFNRATLKGSGHRKVGAPKCEVWFVEGDMQIDMYS